MILTYHRIGNRSSPIDHPLGRFEETLDRLLDAGFEAFDLVDRLEHPRGFAVTFDDGDRSILPALDALEARGARATIFVVVDHVGGWNDWPSLPGWVSRSRLLDWDELADLAARGFTIGSHTMTHVDARRSPLAEVESELVASRAAIEARLGRRCGLFAHPYGRSTRAVRELVAEHYDAALGTDLGIVRSTDDPTNLPRIDAHYLRYEGLLDRLISGTAAPRLRSRQRMRSVREFLRRVAVA
ncbi:MAG: polysaccharide deacetylase family protein [Isosphaeraceae bacterium]|nr:polysaccharide deacetylase family protein [Isosphaeraceae bacterium]